MKYSNTRTSAGQVMPLLIGCTNPSPIEMDEVAHNVIYDPMTQQVVMDLRIVGTKSLKSVSTGYTTSSGHRSTKTDRKNEIDDSKSV